MGLFYYSKLDDHTDRRTDRQTLRERERERRAGGGEWGGGGGATEIGSNLTVKVGRADMMSVYFILL